MIMGVSKLTVRGQTYVRRSAREVEPLASRLSRSVKVIGTATDQQATYDFLLVIHSTHGPISYRFRYKCRLRSKIANFPTLAGREIL